MQMVEAAPVPETSSQSTATVKGSLPACWVAGRDARGRVHTVRRLVLRGLERLGREVRSLGAEVQTVRGGLRRDDKMGYRNDDECQQRNRDDRFDEPEASLVPVCPVSATISADERQMSV